MQYGSLRRDRQCEAIVSEECTLGPAFASARLCNHTFSSSLIWGWLQLPGWEHERKVYVCARHPCRHVRGLQVLLLLVSNIAVAG